MFKIYRKIPYIIMKTRAISSVLLLIFCIALPLIIGYLGSFFTMESISGWYLTLNKPWFNPPGWLFAPVWTLLYILMGISWWLVIRNGFEKPTVRRATIVFLVQLGVNLLWSLVFFGMQSIIGGLGIIVLLVFLILLNMHFFRQVSQNAVFLLIPYLCWTSFATLLNAVLLILNPFW